MISSLYLKEFLLETILHIFPGLAVITDMDMRTVLPKRPRLNGIFMNFKLNQDKDLESHILNPCF